jgi:hypothetical protein
MLNQQWAHTVVSTKVLLASFFYDLPNQDVFGDDRTHLGATQTQILCLSIHTRSHRDTLRI